MSSTEPSSNREQLLRLVINNSNGALIIVDAHLQVIEWCLEAEKLFGWSIGEAVGKTLSSLMVPVHAREEEENAIRQYRENGHHPMLNQRVRVTAVHKNGCPVPIEMILSPLYLDGGLFFSALIQSQSQQRQFPGELHEVLQLLDLSHDAIVVIDAKYRISFWNRGAEHLYGFATIEAIGQVLHDLLHSQYPMSRQELENAFHRDGFWEGEITHRQRNGQLITVLSRCVFQPGNARQPAHIYITNVDIFARKQVQLTSARLAESEQRLSSLIEHHPDAVFSFDLQGKLISGNSAFSKLTGYEQSKLLGMSYLELIMPTVQADVIKRFREVASGQVQVFETIGRRQDGTCYSSHVTGIPIIVNDEVVGIHGMARDITENKRYEDQIKFLASHDALTGLANRTQLEERLKHAIDQAHRQHHSIGILFLDLNRFKSVNDSLGHDKGDMLLRIIGERLANAVRSADTVARFGGDEFVVVSDVLKHAEDLHAVAENLLTVIARPVDLNGFELTVTSSIGGAVYPRDGTTPAELLRAADLAMYRAKELGSGKFTFYSQQMNQEVLDRLRTENGLRKAIKRKEILVHYHPRYDMSAKTIVAVEALVRWQHPEKGILFPNDFIPVAEEIGLIDEICEYVLREACQQNIEWQEAGLSVVRMSVNLSVQQLKSSKIAETVQGILKDTGLKPECLELEVTESALMQNMKDVQAVLMALHTLGVHLSVDDFGTGYSSVSYLKRLPVDTVKIDNQLIQDLFVEVDDTEIVIATIQMAHALNLKVIAEGVSTDEQLQFLIMHQCDEMQGYLFSKPMTGSEISILLAKQ